MILVLVQTPEEFEERLREIAPEMVVAYESGRDARFEEAEIILGRPAVEALDRAKKLRWLQLSSAGANRYAGRVREDVVLTTASGVYGVPGAEHVFAMMLGLVRSVPHSVRSAEKKEWDRGARYDELFGRTCGVLGLGDIGREVARRAHAFGMRVLALKRTITDGPEYVDEVFGMDRLHEFLSRCDHVVNTLPLTPLTAQVIEEEALSFCREGSFFYNIGRGGTVDEAALVRALRSGRLAGCGLDVFEEEPLPPSSPLWSMENVIVTPHVGGASPREADRVADLFLDNLERWRAGHPLRNVVNRDFGY